MDNETETERVLTANEQAFWDAAVLAAIGPLVRVDTVGGDRTVSARVTVASGIADLLLVERRKRMPAGGGG